LTQDLVILDLEFIMKRSKLSRSNEPFVPEVSFLNSLQEKHAFVDLTQFNLDSPVPDAIYLLIGKKLCLIQQISILVHRVN